MKRLVIKLFAKFLNFFGFDEFFHEHTFLGSHCIWLSCLLSLLVLPLSRGISCLSLSPMTLTMVSYFVSIPQCVFVSCFLVIIRRLCLAGRDASERYFSPGVTSAGGGVVGTWHWCVGWLITRQVVLTRYAHHLVKVSAKVLHSKRTIFLFIITHCLRTDTLRLCPYPVSALTFSC